MTKHTQGPWHVERNSANSHSSYPYRICQKTGDDDTRRFIGECWHKEDARLIAAAPELLTALRDLVERIQFEELRDGEYLDLTNERALLARIEGK